MTHSTISAKIKEGSGLPDPEAFAEHFSPNTEVLAVHFPSLGKVFRYIHASSCPIYSVPYCNTNLAYYTDGNHRVDC